MSEPSNKVRSSFRGGECLNTFGILAILAVASVVIIPTAKPSPPTLTTQFLSQSVSLVAWQNFLNLPTSHCLVQITPTVAAGWNFTESLSGRDPGSTWIQFKGYTGQPLYLFRQQDVSLSLITELYCIGPNINLDIANKVQAVFPQGTIIDTAVRVLASGNYVILALSYTNSLPPPIGPFLGNETWTVTTVA